MQYDLEGWNLISEKETKIYFHELILSFSRKKYYTYSLSIKTSDIIRSIVKGIEYLEDLSEHPKTPKPRKLIWLNSLNSGLRKASTKYSLFQVALKEF